MLNRFLNYFLIVLILIFAITFFSRNNFRSVKEINEQLKVAPLQTDLADPNPKEFVRDNFLFKIQPLYDYQLNGLIVHKFDYRLFSLSRSNNAFPIDFCLIWGDNTKSEIYQNRSLDFSQESRWCFARWSGQLDFKTDQVSNNHLIIEDKKLEKIINNLSVGDQVKITGQLVNVQAKNIGKKETSGSEKISLGSSTSRTDTGSGACEVIFVQSIEILKKANPVSFYLFLISRYLIIALILFKVIQFFASLKYSSLDHG